MGKMKIPHSYDIIGSKEKAVAIVEIPDNLKSKEKAIANKIMQEHKNVKSILKKLSERKGKLRIRKFKLIKGSRNTEVTHLEHGYLLKLDPKKVYFSPRELTERQRIANLVKPNETVLIMFGGIAPYAIAMAKKQPKIKKIYTVELNKKAHEYAIENIKLNKLENKIIVLKGDVKKICPKIKKRFDRIVMPLPKEAYKFLDLAFTYTKTKGIIHFYSWASESDLFSDAEKLVKDTTKKFNKKIRITNKKKVLPYGPKKWKIVLDISC